MRSALMADKSSLGSSNNSAKLKVKLLNHKDEQKTITWTAIHTFDGIGQSWGCPALVLLSEIRNEALGWLNVKGKIVLRASVSPSLDEGPNPLEFQFRGERSSITNGSARRAAVDTVESSAKRVKKE
ncbi:hypothetical protein FOZ61_000437 [Perkinsus olseni]|uniref:Uncharacterized protein n=1 Tax=Perkinsus olseni TaxID=32597 RepID=A0A7J6M0R9_PEROL|nr:hypothetical protein FOZ61_000437 [Perkinsus olseni]